jgi:hypothetical protein
MKIDWQAVAVIFACLMTVLGWGVSVEVRMANYNTIHDVHDRLKIIEDNLQILLIDMKVREELDKKGISMHDKPELDPNSDAGKEKEDMLHSAKKWAESQLLKVHK